MINNKLNIPLFYQPYFENYTKKRINLHDKNYSLNTKFYKYIYKYSLSKSIEVITNSIKNSQNYYFLRAYISEKNYLAKKIPYFIVKLKLKINKIKWIYDSEQENYILEIETKQTKYSEYLAKKIIKFSLGSELGQAPMYLEVYIISNKYIINPYDDRGLDIINL